MKRKELLIIFVLVLLIGGIFFYLNSKKVTFFEDVTVELGSTHNISEYIKNGEVKDDSMLDTSTLGQNEIIIKVNNKEYTFKYNVIDTEAPVIENAENISVFVGANIDLLDGIIVKDNSNEEIIPTVEGQYDLKKVGTYNLYYVAKDSSGNETKEEFTLLVKNKIVANTYTIKVNKTHNVVMVYDNDLLIKTFLCSTGENTPIGTFTATDKYATLRLVGDVYGHYTMRIVESIWFHSVPYFSKPTMENPYWNDLEYEEYNKLGTSASLGCVRLKVIDAKWIYDNIPKGTTVEIYEGDLPTNVIVPSFTYIDPESPNRGWDPTDPDVDNPWNK